MYCSVIMRGIFSFISMSDLNNVRKFITTTMYMKLTKWWNLHPSLHGSMVRHQDMNPKENQRSVVQGSQGKY